MAESPNPSSQSLVNWQVLTNDDFDAAGQMAHDEQLATTAGNSPAVRFFCWSPPALSFGLKQPHPAWFDAGKTEASGLQWVHRPTGGALALHGSDVSWSLVFPQNRGFSLDTLMRRVCECARSLCSHFGVEANALLDAPAAGRVTYCLAETSPYAIMIGSKKVMGFAIRRFPETWLIQASLLIGTLPKPVEAALPDAVRTEYKKRAAALSESAGKKMTAAEVKACCAQNWQQWWNQSEG